MNYSDMKGVTSILTSLGCYVTREAGEADLWLVMTCSIREGTENKVWSKLSHKEKSKTSGSYARELQQRLKFIKLDQSYPCIYGSANSIRSDLNASKRL